jgi:hypothetical protein
MKINFFLALGVYSFERVLQQSSWNAANPAQVKSAYRGFIVEIKLTLV